MLPLGILFSNTDIKRARERERHTHRKREAEMTGLSEDGVPPGNLSGRHHFDIDVIGECYMFSYLSGFL